MSFRSRYGPWAVVAGGSDGIGAEFAAQLAGRGLNLVIVARRSALLEEVARRTVDEFGVEVRALSLDLSKRDQVEGLLAATTELDVGLLVCNAAMATISPFLDEPTGSHERMIDLNIRMPLLLSLELGRRMRKAGRGGIILLSSMAAFQGTELAAHYAATKAYLRILAEGLWAELRSAGVDVLAVCPATVNTPTFLREEPQRGGWLVPATLESGFVVAASLKALGRKPVVVPGAQSALAVFAAERLLPRRLVIALTGRGTKAMYRPRWETLRNGNERAVK